MDNIVRTAIVTGASRGLGRATAERLARNGVAVGLVARDAVALDEVVADIRSVGGRAVAIPGDLAVPADVDRIVAEAFEALGTVDALVHAAGALGPVPLPLLLDLDPADLRSTFEVNVFGAFRLVCALVGPMVVRGSGVVAGVSSDAAVAHYPGWGAYAASKAAVDHLWGTLAAEVGGAGVTVFVIDPGEMDTAMHAAAMPDADRSTLAAPAAVADWWTGQILDPRRGNHGARLQAEV